MRCHIRSILPFMLIAAALLIIPSTASAGTVTLTVSPAAPIAEIGKNFVLEVLIVPESGQTISANEVVIEVTTRDAHHPTVALRSEQPKRDASRDQNADPRIR